MHIKNISQQKLADNVSINKSTISRNKNNEQIESLPVKIIGVAREKRTKL